MIYTVDSQSRACIDFAPATVVNEVLQNIATLLGTVRGSVPLDREFGVSGVSVGRRFPAAEFGIVAGVHAAIAEYEPRAEVRDVRADYDANGTILIQVEVTIHGTDTDFS